MLIRLFAIPVSRRAPFSAVAIVLSAYKVPAFRQLTARAIAVKRGYSVTDQDRVWVCQLLTRNRPPLARHHQQSTCEHYLVWLHARDLTHPGMYCIER